MKLAPTKTLQEPIGELIETWVVDVEKVQEEHPELLEGGPISTSSFNPEQAVPYLHIYDGGKPYPGKYIKALGELDQMECKCRPETS